jgi:hypothetical protein
LVALALQLVSLFIRATGKQKKKERNNIAKMRQKKARDSEGGREREYSVEAQRISLVTTCMMRIARIHV